LWCSGTRRRVRIGESFEEVIVEFGTVRVSFRTGIDSVDLRRNVETITTFFESLIRVVDTIRKLVHVLIS
jgi:hypothetical protein